jgi:hypothetical protein
VALLGAACGIFLVHCIFTLPIEDKAVVASEKEMEEWVKK